MKRMAVALFVVVLAGCAGQQHCETPEEHAARVDNAQRTAGAVASGIVTTAEILHILLNNY